MSEAAGDEADRAVRKELGDACEVSPYETVLSDLYRGRRACLAGRRCTFFPSNHPLSPIRLLPAGRHDDDAPRLDG
jgi:hypothetical protein